MQKLRQIEVKGKKFTVSINDEGHFFADFDAEQVRAESLKQLTEKLASRITKMKRVNIPICMWEKKKSWSDGRGRLRTGTILGIHGSNNNLLVKFDDEPRSEQVSYGDFFELKDGPELKRLAEAVDTAEKAFEEFKKEREIDAREKVRELINVAGSAEEAQAEKEQ